jgi:hypothetical protein
MKLCRMTNPDQVSRARIIADYRHLMPGFSALALTFRTSAVDYLRITAARARGRRMSGAAMMPDVPRGRDDQWGLPIIASRSFRT